jgi:two-component system response regulator
MDREDAVDILLVEDDPQDAELAIRALRRANLGDRVVVVSDGAEVLDFFHCRGRHADRTMDRAPRVVLLDLKLPKLSGLDVLRELRSLERLQAVPVVVLTSSASDPDVAAAYDLGANSYVVKPVDAASFQEAVSRLGAYWLLVNQVPGQ